MIDIYCSECDEINFCAKCDYLFMWVGSIKRCIPEIKISNLIKKGKSLKTVFGIVILVPKIHS